MSPASGMVVLLRHGEAERREGAPLEGRLTTRGVDQARAAGAWLRRLGVERVLTSDTARAVETAGHLGGPGAEQVAELAGLRIGPGDERPMRGHEHILAVFGDPASRSPGGESLEDLLARTASVVDELLDGRERVAVVAHRMVNSVVLGRLLGLDLAGSIVVQQDPGAVNVITGRSPGPSVPALNFDPSDPLRQAPAGARLPDTDVAVERRVLICDATPDAPGPSPMEVDVEVEPDAHRRGLRVAELLGVAWWRDAGWPGITMLDRAAGRWWLRGVTPGAEAAAQVSGR